MMAAVQDDYSASRYILNTASRISFAEGLTLLSNENEIYTMWLALHTFCMLVAKSGRPHVAHLDAPTTAAVQKHVTM